LLHLQGLAAQAGQIEHDAQAGERASQAQRVAGGFRQGYRGFELGQRRRMLAAAHLDQPEQRQGLGLARGVAHVARIGQALRRQALGLVGVLPEQGLGAGERVLVRAARRRSEQRRREQAGEQGPPHPSA
jgi:hypothetical protein